MKREGDFGDGGQTRSGSTLVFMLCQLPLVATVGNAKNHRIAVYNRDIHFDLTDSRPKCDYCISFEKQE